MSTTSTAMVSAITTASAGAMTRSAPAGPSALTSTQFVSLLATIESSDKRLDSKLAAFKADVKQAQDDTATKDASCIQNETPHAYKIKGNEEQACFNSQVEDALQDVEDALCDAAPSPAMK